MIEKLYRVGLEGMQTGLSSAARNATKISNSFKNDSPSDLVDGVVGLALDEVQVRASARVVRVADELSKSVLDILA